MSSFKVKTRRLPTQMLRTSSWRVSTRAPSIEWNTVLRLQTRKNNSEAPATIPLSIRAIHLASVVLKIAQPRHSHCRTSTCARRLSQLSLSTRRRTVTVSATKWPRTNRLSLVQPRSWQTSNHWTLLQHIQALSSVIRSTLSIMVVEEVANNSQLAMQVNSKPWLAKALHSTIRVLLATCIRVRRRARQSTRSRYLVGTHGARSARARAARTWVPTPLVVFIRATLTTATWSTSTTPTCSTRCSQRTIQATNNSSLRNSINLNKSLEPRTYGKAHRVLWQTTLHQLSVARANKTNNSSRWLIRCCGSSRCI